MTTPSQIGKVPPRVIEGRTDDTKSARRPALWAAGAASAAAAIAVVALLVDVVRSPAGEQPAAGDAVAAAVAVGALVVVAVLAILSAVNRPALAGALTAGSGAVSSGLAVMDLGLVGSPIDSNRLELFRPTTAEALQAAPGAYLMVTAHALAAVAGLFGLLAISRASFADGYGHSVRAELSGRATAARIGGPLALVVGIAAVVAAVSMFAPPYVSTDSIVLVRAIVEAPLTTSIGSAIVAVAVLVVVSAALASISPIVASGALLGAGLGLFGVAGVRVLAGGSSGPTISISPGAGAGAAASIVIIVVALLVLPVTAVKDRRAGTERKRRPGVVDGGAAFMRWHVAAGVLGVVAGVLLVASGFLRVLDVPAGLPEPTILATRTAVVAGVVLVLVSVPLFFSLFAASVRPVLGVLAVAGVMSATGVLQSVVLATDIDAISLGPGAVASAAGVLAAFGCGVAVLLAGSAEREDVDTSDGHRSGISGLLGTIGAVVSAVALGLPLYRGQDLTAASFGEFPWGWDAWGQALLAAAVLGASVVASRSRPPRSAALLLGSAVAMGLYVLGWPLTRARTVDPVIGAGALLGLAGVVILAVAALLSARQQVK